MPRGNDLIDDLLDAMKDAAIDFVQQRFQIPAQPKQPRARRVSKAPKVKKPKAERPVKRERTEPTLYEVLGVDAKAEPEVIEAAWKAKARLYHPDRNKSASAAAKMQAVNAAHDVLGNGTARRTYDANLKQEAR